MLFLLKGTPRLMEDRRNRLRRSAGLLLLLSLSPLAAQVHQAWIARYNGPASGDDIIQDMVIDGAGNIYIAGSSDGGFTGDDYTVIKYDRAGNQLWLRRYNGASLADRATALAVDHQGNVYVTGWSEDGRGFFDYVTIKYGPNGHQLWVARYNGPANDNDIASAIAVDDSGNVYVTGSSWGSDDTGWNYLTIKYSPNGNERWTQTYNGPGSQSDYAFKIVLDGLGSVYVAGSSIGLGTRSDFCAIKYNLRGEQLWVRRYNGTFNGIDNATDIITDNQGNLYITGSSEDSSSRSEYNTVKYDTNGNVAWIAHYSGDISGHNGALSIVLDNIGNVYVVGSSWKADTNVDYAAVKYDLTGDELWAQRYNGAGVGDDYAYDLALDLQGNVYVIGGSTGVDRRHNLDVVTIKYNPNGQMQWLQRYNGPGGCTGIGCSNTDVGYRIAVDALGKVNVAGWSFEYLADFVTIQYCQQPGDANQDGFVDDADLAVVLFAFGSTGPEGDLNLDAVVDDSDLAEVIFHFGERCQ